MFRHLKDGWTLTDILVKYWKHFIQHVKPSVTNKCLVILDGHSSHKSLAAVTLAKENYITMVTIPPHTSHRLQPLDVSFFGPLKSRYNRELDKWMVVHPGKPVGDYDIAELFAHAYEATAFIDKATKTGIMHCVSDNFNGNQSDPLPGPMLAVLFLTTNFNKSESESKTAAVDISPAATLCDEHCSRSPLEKHWAFLKCIL